MPYPDNLLVTGEKIYVRKRPHWKVLILPIVFFILIIAGCAALLAFLNGRDWPSWVTWAIVAVAVIALIVLVLVPFIRWRTEHFVISNHHIFFRTGLLSRREHQIPLGQIANIETDVTFWGRLMGYGSLIVESSADQPLKFRNVANLSKVQSMLNQLIRDEKELLHRGHLEVDDWAAGDAPDDRDRPRPEADTGTAQPAAHSGTGQPATGQWPAQQAAGQEGQPPAYGQPYGQPAYGQGYPPPQQGYPPPGQTYGYPPQGGPGYPQQGAPGYPPQGYQQTAGYPSNYPQQASYPSAPGGYPPPSGHPAGAPGYPPGGYQQGYQQPTYPPPGAQRGSAPSSGSFPAAGEPPASAEPTVYTRSPAARSGEDRGADRPSDALDEPEPTVLTRSPMTAGAASSTMGASSAKDAAPMETSATGSSATGSSATGAATPAGSGGAARGRHAQPTESTPLPNFDEPEPTVMMRSPGADAGPPAGHDEPTGPADASPRP